MIDFIADTAWRFAGWLDTLVAALKGPEASQDASLDEEAPPGRVRW